MQGKQLPIGYWIKQADLLLTKVTDEIQSSFGMTRTEWQILNSISEKDGIEKMNLINLMLPFADTKSVENILTKFKTRHLINEDNSKLNLTDKGTKLYSECFEKQKTLRQSVMVDISEQDYQTTVLTLVKIVENISRKPV